MKAGLLGAGAVGCSLVYFAGRSKEEISVIAEGKRKEGLEKGILINDKRFYADILSKEASPLDLLFISVKSTGFEEALEEIRDYIDEKTIIVSLLNGISSEKRIRDLYGNPVVHAVVRGSFIRKEEEVSFKENQVYITIGEYGGNKEAVEIVKDYLASIKYPFIVSEDILSNMWSKFCINVSENLIAGALDLNYGKMKHPEFMEAIKLVQKEVVKVGNANGAHLSEETIEDNLKALRGEVDQGIPSTLQDLRAGRRTEVDMLAGEMIRLGERSNISTPYSRLLYHFVKGKEEMGSIFVESDNDRMI